MGIQINGTTDTISAADGSLSVTSSESTFSGISTFNSNLNVIGSTSDDLVRITQTGAGNALVVEDSANPDSTPFVVNASGLVGIGTDNPIMRLHVHGAANSADSRIRLSSIEGSGLTIRAQSATENNINADSGEDITFSRGNVESLRITSSGNVGIGTTNPATNFKLDVNGDLSLGEFGGTDNTYIDQKQNGSLDIINSGVAANTGRIRINRVNNISEDTTYYRDFELYDGKSNKIIEVDGSAAMTRIHMGTDKVVQFQGNIGEIGNVAGFQATNTVGSANTDFGIRATTIRFATGSSEKLRILAGGGLTFNGDTAAANALDDYEEGTFDPIYRGGTTDGTPSYATRVGRYIKIGQLVHLTIIVSGTISGASGQLEFGGMPFVPAQDAVGTFQANNAGSYASNVGQYSAYIGSGANYMTFRGTKTDGTSHDNLSVRNVTFMRASITFRVS